MPNSSATKSNLECDICGVVLMSTKNLRRHKKSMHLIQGPDQPNVKCNECLEEFTSIAGTKQRIQFDHCQSAIKHCVYCKKVLTSFEGYQSHMNNMDCHYGLLLLLLLRLAAMTITQHLANRTNIFDQVKQKLKRLSIVA